MNQLDTVTNQRQELKDGNARTAGMQELIASALDAAWNALTESTTPQVLVLIALAERLQGTLPGKPGGEEGLRLSLLTLALLLRHTERNLVLLHGADQDGPGHTSYSLRSISHERPRAFAEVTPRSIPVDTCYGRPTIWHH